MVDYIKSIILIGVASSLVIISLPKSEENSGRYVRQMSAFLVLLVMLSPLKNMSAFVTAVSEGIDTFAERDVDGMPTYSAEAVIGKSAETISRYIIEICKTRFGIDNSEVRVKLILDENDTENVLIQELQVFTPLRDTDLIREVEKYLKDLFDTKVYVFGS